MAALLVVALLVGTSVAFVATEVLKQEKAPITDTEIDKLFSPVCPCPHRAARIVFRLTQSDALTLEILNRPGRVVRTIIRSRVLSGGLHRFHWNGRDAAGGIVRDGSYRIRVRLRHQGRTLVLPNLLRVDSTAPRVRFIRLRPRSIVRNGFPDSIVARYRSDEPVFAILLVDGQLAVRKRFAGTSGSLRWFGRSTTLLFPPVRHRVSVAGIDLAGNSARPTRSAWIVIH